MRLYGSELPGYAGLNLINQTLADDEFVRQWEIENNGETPFRYVSFWVILNVSE